MLWRQSRYSQISKTISGRRGTMAPSVLCSYQKQNNTTKTSATRHLTTETKATELKLFNTLLFVL